MKRRIENWTAKILLTQKNKEKALVVMAGASFLLQKMQSKPAGKINIQNNQILTGYFDEMCLRNDRRFYYLSYT